MIRSNSRSKWKDVLGFDDGYSYSSTNPTSPVSSNSSYSISPELTYRPLPIVQPSYPRFPRDITFFRSKSDILLSPSPPAPSPNDLKPLPAPPHLFHITIQKDPITDTSTGRPDVLLHSGPSKASTIISYAKFHSITLNSDITLCPLAPKPISSNFSRTNFPVTSFSRTTSPEARVDTEFHRPKFHVERLSPTGGLFTTEKYTFYHTLPWRSTSEKFEWRHSSGPFIRTLDSTRDSGGLKLVRTSTGDVLAVYAGLGPSSKASNPNRVVGMFRFLKNDGMVGLGEEFEVLAIMTLMSIIEKGKRETKANREAFGIK